MNIASDISKIIYGEFSVDAVYNDSSIKCIFNNETEIIEEGMVIDAVPSAEFVKDDVSGIKAGDSIIIDNVSYTVNEVFELKATGTIKVTLTKGQLYE